jgi:hypothetical protein
MCGERGKVGEFTIAAECASEVIPAWRHARILGASRSTPGVVELERRLTARVGCRPPAEQRTPPNRGSASQPGCNARSHVTLSVMLRPKILRGAVRSRSFASTFLRVLIAPQPLEMDQILERRRGGAMARETRRDVNNGHEPGGALGFPPLRE